MKVENSFFSKIKLSQHYLIGTRGLEQFGAAFPLTRLGVLLALSSGFGLWFFGFLRHDLVWYVGALSGLALICLSLMSVILGSFYLSKSIQRSLIGVSKECVTDTPWCSEFALPSVRFALLDIQFDWSVPNKSVVEAIVEGETVSERVTLFEHGNFDQVRRHIKVSDFLGLASITLSHSLSSNIAVLPNKGRLTSVPWLASLSDGGDLPHPSGAAVGDRLELRRYDAGDPARFIHWKAFARTGKLMHREPERSVSRTHRTAVYMVAGRGDGASAGAALAVLDANALGVDWVFGADGTSELLYSIYDVKAAIRRSASQRSKGAQGLVSYLSKLESQGEFNLLLFVPACSAEWEAKVASALAKPNLRCNVVIGFDGLKARQGDYPRIQRWLKSIDQAEPAASIDEQALGELATRLDLAGANVLIADRTSGRLFNRHNLSTQPVTKKRGKSVIDGFARNAS